MRKSLPLALLFATTLLPLAAQSLTTLPGHALEMRHQATLLPRNPLHDSDTLTIGVMLNLSDPAGYDAFRQDFNNPDSPNYHQPINGRDFTAQFGPSVEAYNAVLNYFEQQGFVLVTGSENRRTLTLHSTRAQAESAFHQKINDYQLGAKTFHTLGDDPALPSDIAPLVAGVSGLSNLGHWQPASSAPKPYPGPISQAYGGLLTPAGSTNSGGLPPGLNGSGQTIGILSFYNFNSSDISNWLSQAGLPASLISNVSTYTVGIGSPLGTNPETVLDIDAALGMAPGAKIVVYIAPYYSGEEASDFYTPISTAADNMWSTGGVISASYGACESLISSSDAANMDSFLESASYVGVTLFAATGDNGSTCFDPGGPTFYPNVVSYPADLPHAVAVGGTSLYVDSSGNYASEDWWNAGFGAGGYGVSSFFPEPSYQTPLYKGAGGRSIPDVAMDADPNTGMNICLGTTTKGTPHCFEVGGTSMATPLFAGLWAIASQANVDAKGYTWSPIGDYFYKIPGAFNSASTIVGGDFADVGLGSPIIPAVISKGIPPSISDFTPTTGPSAGGTVVTITGVGFIGVEKVTFGGVAGTHLAIHSDSKLTVETPAAPSLLAEIAVVTPGGTAKVSDFTYAPEITNVGPNQGPLDAGTSVTVTGLALSDSLSFVFGTTAATSVKCSSSTSCTMIAPAHAAGTVDILANTPWGYANSTPNPKDRYTYEAPTITSFTPNVGATTGGIIVAITGLGFENGKTSFGFDGVPGTDVYCTGSTFCSVTSPAHAAGAIHVTATVAGTTGAPSSSVFTYVVYPTITGISPSSIPVNSGTVPVTVTLTLTGTGFSNSPGATVFNYGGNAPLSGVSCSSTTQCTASYINPAFISTARVTTTSASVTVTVNGLTSLDYVAFSYPSALAPPPHCKGTTCF
jgi:hypothetical protein